MITRRRLFYCLAGLPPLLVLGPARADENSCASLDALSRSQRTGAMRRSFEKSRRRRSTGGSSGSGYFFSGTTSQGPRASTSITQSSFPSQRAAWGSLPVRAKKEPGGTGWSLPSTTSTRFPDMTVT